MSKKLKKNPWDRTDFEKADASALQALVAGGAEDYQQKRAIEFIINELCATYDLSFRPGECRDTDFAEGKRWVGLQLVHLLKVNVSKMK